MFTDEQLEAELERRKCVPNEYTGVTPLLVKLNGRYQKIVPKFQPLFTIAGICDGMPDQTEGYDFFTLNGGRGGAKSESLAHLLLEIAEKEHDTVCLCTREVQNSVEESVYSYIEKWITRLGYQDHYKCIQNKIINTKTNFIFRFKGLQSSTRAEALKGLSEAKYVWCEEARTLSQKSLDMLLPSVRVEGRKLFFGYNNGKETDAVETLQEYDETMSIPVNIYDNPFCPKTMWTQCQADKRIDYEKYLHIWEGHYLKDDPSRTIVPFEWLERCLDAHKTIGYEPVGKLYAGLDVAEGETTKHDKNSIVIRQGPVIKHWETWQCKNIYESVDRVKSVYYDWGFDEVYYDAVGVGVGYASEVARIDAVEEEKLPFDSIPFKGSTSVYGAESIYTRHNSKIVRNKDFFKNSKSQQWWNLRLMAQNTMKLLDGKKIDRPDYFLSFDGDLNKWRDVFNEISQATFKEDGSGRKMVEKSPSIRDVDDGLGNKQKVRSPNAGDACGYSVVKYFENGLRAHGSEIEKNKEEEFTMPTMTL
jgi:phage terminase large subunit